MKTLAFPATMAVLVLAATATPSLAQQKTDYECESVIYTNPDQGGQRPTDGIYSTPVNNCIAGSVSRYRNLYVPFVVQGAVARSFGIGPTGIEPTGLTGIVAGEVEDRLSASSFDIVPTASTTAATKWNGWVDGRYQYSDYADSAGDLDGPTRSGMVGLDYKIGSRLSLGLLGSIDRTVLESALTDYESGSKGVGPYVGLVITDNIVFSGSLLRSWVESSLAGGLVAFETDRIQASGSLNGYWYKGNWRFTPGVTVSWSKDWEEEVNGLLPDRTIETGILTPSVQFGNTVRISDHSTVEPWLGAALDYTFLNDIHSSGLGTISDTSTDLRLQAGLNFAFGSRAQLAITGEASGLLLDDVDAYSIQANFAMQF